MAPRYQYVSKLVPAPIGGQNRAESALRASPVVRPEVSAGQVLSQLSNNLQSVAQQIDQDQQAEARIRARQAARAEAEARKAERAAQGGGGRSRGGRRRSRRGSGRGAARDTQKKLTESAYQTMEASAASGATGLELQELEGYLNQQVAYGTAEAAIDERAGLEDMARDEWDMTVDETVQRIQEDPVFAGVYGAEVAKMAEEVGGVLPPEEVQARAENFQRRAIGAEVEGHIEQENTDAAQETIIANMPDLPVDDIRALQARLATGDKASLALLKRIRYTEYASLDIAISRAETIDDLEAIRGRMAEGMRIGLFDGSSSGQSGRARLTKALDARFEDLTEEQAEQQELLQNAQFADLRVAVATAKTPEELDDILVQIDTLTREGVFSGSEADQNARTRMLIQVLGKREGLVEKAVTGQRNTTIADWKIAIADASTVDEVQTLRQQIEAAQESGFFDDSASAQGARVTLLQSLSARYDRLQKISTENEQLMRRLTEPGGVDSQSDANKAWEVLRQTIPEGENPADHLLQFARTTGYIPKNVQQALSVAEGSQDVNQIAEAAMLYSSLANVNDQLNFGLSSGSSRVRETAAYSRVMGVSYEQAAQHILDARGDERVVKARQTAFRRLLKEVAPVQTLQRAYSEEAFIFGIGGLSDSAIPLEAQQLYTEALYEAYISIGNAQVAEEAASARVKEVYAVTEVGGNRRLTRYAPESLMQGPAMAYLSRGERARVIDDDLQVSAQGVGLNIPKGSGIYRLIADTETENALKQGRTPTYEIRVLDEFGAYAPVRTGVGTYMRYALPEPEDVRETETYRRRVQGQLQRGAAERAARERQEGVTGPLGGTLDMFFGDARYSWPLDSGGLNAGRN